MEQYSKRNSIPALRRRIASSNKVLRTSAEFQQSPGSPRGRLQNKKSDPLTGPGVFSEVDFQHFSFRDPPSKSYGKKGKKITLLTFIR